MKILAFVDTHGNLTATEKIIKKARKAELLVCAGDLTIFEQHLDYWLYKLNEIGKPVLIIHGNHELANIMKKLCSVFKNINYLDKKSYSVGKYLFLGYGGGGFSLRDKDFEKSAKRFSKLITKNKITVLITHGPPYSCKLDLIMDEHCGCKSIRKFIEKNKINLVICGHLHENSGKEDKIGDTIVINPGPYGKIVEI